MLSDNCTPVFTMIARLKLYVSQKLSLGGLILLLFIASCSESRSLQSDDKNNLYDVITVTSPEPFPDSSFLTTIQQSGYFPIVKNGIPGTILVSPSDHQGVIKTAGYFQKDLSRISGQEATLMIADKDKADNLIIAGTAGKSNIIDQLVKEGKIDISGLRGKWEKFIITSVDDPMEGVGHALVIVGSDKRGTIFGMFELSGQMGVSPWYWWADVPVKERKNIFVKSGIHTLGEPKIKYRGIFINDEAPALSGWAQEKFGGFNHQFYEKVFELILRLKGNYLWPAMWGSSLWDDDSLSAPLADQMGIVLSTSHHEPLMRSHVEWSRYGHGPWDYEKNPEALREFWRKGMERRDGHNSVVTLGMRGDGDKPMTQGTAIDLLENIVKDQRQIIEDVTGKPAEETPQVWALYKEVQEYYDRGMRVPNDVTLLLCDDNWGNVRILPDAESATRTGGYGMYYHFDFVGGPRSYRWLNTVQIERVWEQMHLSYEYGVDKIWLVNVGDLKPMEFPISFFLDYAWNPDNLPAEKLPDYYTAWAGQQFGIENAKQIGDILALYTKYNARRKPELLDPSTYSLKNFDEADNVVSEYNLLVEKAKKIGGKLPDQMHAAFYQLIQFPVEACANLNEMYVLTAKNHLYAKQHRILTNELAKRVKEDFNKDVELSAYYHTILGGKWDHIMSQVHIGYTTWADPGKAVMPEVDTIEPMTDGKLGITLPGIEDWWPEAGGQIQLETFDPYNKQTREVELFNQGDTPVSFTIKTNAKWIKVDSWSGKITTEQRISVNIDWSGVPEDRSKGKLTITGNGQSVDVIVPVNKLNYDNIKGFVENNGIVSIEAANFQHAQETKSVSWGVIPNLGRTGSSVTPLPVTAPKQDPGGDNPFLEYTVFILDSGLYHLTAFFSPTLNFQKDEGLIYAFSIDDSEPEIENMHKDAKVADWLYPAWWNNAVTNNIMTQSVLTKELSAGPHTIKYRMVDPGIVLQKITLTKAGVDLDSYLGPPESLLIKK